MSPEDSCPLKVLLVDDHHIVREGLRTIITRAGMEVVGEAGTAAALLRAARFEPPIRGSEYCF
jgi:DNA-binding NarL/FixJ family response regulator